MLLFSATAAAGHNNCMCMYTIELKFSFFFIRSLTKFFCVLMNMYIMYIYICGVFVFYIVLFCPTDTHPAKCHKQITRYFSFSHCWSETISRAFNCLSDAYDFSSLSSSFLSPFIHITLFSVFILFNFTVGDFKVSFIHSSILTFFGKNSFITAPFPPSSSSSSQYLS